MENKDFFSDKNAEAKEKEEIKEAEKKYSKKDLNPYSINKFEKIPYGVKAVFLKFWLFGAVDFFIAMGLGIYDLDYIVFGGLVYGVFQDVILNKIYLLMDSDEPKSQYYSIFVSKKFYSVIINLVYGVGIFYLGSLCTKFIGQVTIAHFGQNAFVFGGEPLTFGLLMLVIDSVFLLIKYGIMKLVKKNK